jgi:hypothetical protein
MADIISDHVWPEGSSSRKYPWESWLDGQTRILIAGQDFEGSPYSVREGAYKYAKRKGIRVRTAILAADRLVLQAFPESESHAS